MKTYYKSLEYIHKIIINLIEKVGLFKGKPDYIEILHCYNTVFLCICIEIIFIELLPGTVYCVPRRKLCADLPVE